MALIETTETPEDIERLLEKARAELQAFEDEVDGERLLARVKRAYPAHPVLLGRALFLVTGGLFLVCMVGVMGAGLFHKPSALFLSGLQAKMGIPGGVPAVCIVLALCMFVAYFMATLAAQSIGRETPMLMWEAKEYQKLVNEVTRLTTQKAVMERIRGTPGGARPRIATPVPMSMRNRSPGGRSPSAGGFGGAFGNSDNSAFNPQSTGFGGSGRDKAENSLPPYLRQTGSTASSSSSGSGNGFGNDRAPSFGGMGSSPATGNEQAGGFGGASSGGGGFGGNAPAAESNYGGGLPPTGGSLLSRARSGGSPPPTEKPGFGGGSPSFGQGGFGSSSPPPEPNSSPSYVDFSDDIGTERSGFGQDSSRPSFGSFGSEPNEERGGFGGGSSSGFGGSTSGGFGGGSSGGFGGSSGGGFGGSSSGGFGGSSSGFEEEIYPPSVSFDDPPPNLGDETDDTAGIRIGLGSPTRGGTPLGAPPRAGVSLGVTRLAAPMGFPGTPEPSTDRYDDDLEEYDVGIMEDLSYSSPSQPDTAPPRVGIQMARVRQAPAPNPDELALDVGDIVETLAPGALVDATPDTNMREKGLPRWGRIDEMWLEEAIEKAENMVRGFPKQARLEFSVEENLPFTLVIEQATPAMAVRAMVGYVEFLASIYTPQKARIELRKVAHLDRSFHRNVDAALQPYFAGKVTVENNGGQVDILFQDPDPGWDAYPILPME